MRGFSQDDRTGRRSVAGFALLAVLLSAALAAAIVTGTEDPEGMASASAIAVADAPRMEPLYGAAWTPYGSLDWSPDGRWLALGGESGSGVDLVDARTGVVMQSWEVAGVTVVRWSPNGTELAIGVGSFFAPNPGWLSLYASNGSLIRGWQAEDWQMGGLAWSPDGTRIVTTTMNRYDIWDARSGALIRSDANASVGRDLQSGSVDWSPDGRRIAFEGEGGPSVYDAASGSLLWQATRNGSLDYRSVAWSHAGDRLAASDSEGCLDIFAANGRYMQGYNETYEGSARCIGSWTRRPSWNPSDMLIAVPTTGGVRVFDATTGDLLRTLVFPVDNYGPSGGISSYGPGTSRDFDAEWSPSGNALASTGSMTNPSLRLWGIRGGAVARWSSLFHGILVAGLPLALGPLFVAILVRPADSLGLPSRRSPAFAPGLAMLAALFLIAALQQSEFSLEGRLFGAQVIPPATWFVWNLLASLGFAIVPTLAGVLTFAGVTWPLDRGGTVPSRGAAARILAWALVPVVWCLSVAYLLIGLLAAAGLGPDPLASSGIVALLGGLGVWLAATVMTKVPGTAFARALAGLLAAAGVSLAVGFVEFLLLFEVLSTSRVALPGVWGTYGLSLNFGFGLAPWFASLGLLVVLGAGYAMTVAPPRFLLPLFTRLRRQDVLDQASRQRVLAFLDDHPGVHFRELMRALPMGNGSLHYHLYVLEREGFVVAQRDGMYRRFFVSDRASRPNRAP